MNPLAIVRPRHVAIAMNPAVEVWGGGGGDDDDGDLRVRYKERYSAVPLSLSLSLPLCVRWREIGFPAWVEQGLA